MLFFTRERWRCARRAGVFQQEFRYFQQEFCPTSRNFAIHQQDFAKFRSDRKNSPASRPAGREPPSRRRIRFAVQVLRFLTSSAPRRLDAGILAVGLRLIWAESRSGHLLRLAASFAVDACGSLFHFYWGQTVPATRLGRGRFLLARQESAAET